MNFEKQIDKEKITSALDCLLQSGIISQSSAETAMQAMKQKEFIAKKKYIEEVHNHTITPPHDNEKRWKTYICVDGGRKLLAKTKEEDFFEALYAFYNGSSATSGKKKILPHHVSIQSLYPEWLEFKALHTNSPSYLKRIEGTWRSFYKDTEIVKLPLSQLGKLELDVWSHQLIQGHNMTKKQYYNTTVIMRQILEYACDKEILEANPMNRVKIDSRRMFRKEIKKEDSSQVFTDREVDAITVEAYKDYKSPPRNTIHVLAPLAVLFQFQTGVRIGELCALRYEDIHGDYIRINRMVIDHLGTTVDHNKGNADSRDVFLTMIAKIIINEAHSYQVSHDIPADGFIFSVNEKPVLYRSIQRLYNRYCDRIGIKRKSSHKARKTYISSLIDAGVNINTVRKLAGHSDEKITLRNYVYDRSEESERNEMIQKALEYHK